MGGRTRTFHPLILQSRTWAQWNMAAVTDMGTVGHGRSHRHWHSGTWLQSGTWAQWDLSSLQPRQVDTRTFHSSALQLQTGAHWDFLPLLATPTSGGCWNLALHTAAADKLALGLFIHLYGAFHPSLWGLSSIILGLSIHHSGTFHPSMLQSQSGVQRDFSSLDTAVTSGGCCHVLVPLHRRRVLWTGPFRPFTLQPLTEAYGTFHSLLNSFYCSQRRVDAGT